MKKKTKGAFTLAEVLIALTIIGVVSALTVPVVVSRQGDAELTARFKKAYSVLTNMQNKINMLDFGGNVQCHMGVKNSNGGAGTADCHEFWEKFRQDTNTAKVCKGNAKRDNCVPSYPHYNNAGGCGGGNPFKESAINNVNTVTVLTDGTTVIHYPVGEGADGFPIFLVDINGMKGPNKGGYDLFAFAYVRNEDTGNYSIRDFSACQVIENGGRSTQDMMMHALAGKE